MRKILCLLFIVCIVACSNPVTSLPEVKPLTACLCLDSRGPLTVQIFDVLIWNGVGAPGNFICTVKSGECVEVNVSDGTQLMAQYYTGNELIVLMRSAVIAHKGEYWQL